MEHGDSRMGILWYRDDFNFSQNNFDTLQNQQLNTHLSLYCAIIIFPKQNFHENITTKENYKSLINILCTYIIQ